MNARRRRRDGTVSAVHPIVCDNYVTNRRTWPVLALVFPRHARRFCLSTASGAARVGDRTRKNTKRIIDRFPYRPASALLPRGNVSCGPGNHCSRGVFLPETRAEVVFFARDFALGSVPCKKKKNEKKKSKVSGSLFARSSAFAYHPTTTDRSRVHDTQLLAVVRILVQRFHDGLIAFARK